MEQSHHNDTGNDNVGNILIAIVSSPLLHTNITGFPGGAGMQDMSTSVYRPHNAVDVHVGLLTSHHVELNSGRQQ